MNFVVLYCIKNQYEMIEEYVFKHSSCDFSKVDILIYDDGSESEQINKLKKLCDDFKNISWINENEEKYLNKDKFVDDSIMLMNRATQSGEEDKVIKSLVKEVLIDK